MQVVTNKATFIFDCPKESLSISCINEMGLIFKDCIEYGVNGCGKKSVYSKIGNSWVMTDSK